MAKTKSNPKATVVVKTSQKSRKPSKPSKPSSRDAARKIMLGRITKPQTKATMAHKKFFKDFLTRLEKRDMKLEQSDLEVASEDAMNYVFDEDAGEMVLEWEVEEILDTRTMRGELQYMVLWKGHLLEECTWENKENLANSRQAIEDYYVAFPNKTRDPGVTKKSIKSTIERHN